MSDRIRAAILDLALQRGREVAVSLGGREGFSGRLAAADARGAGGGRNDARDPGHQAGSR